MQKQVYSAKDEKALMTEIWSEEISENPLAFVMFAFPWGKEGTPLEKEKGPRKWQSQELIRIRDHIKMNKERMNQGLTPLVYKSATASGRGVGKSALTAWLNLWHLSCRIGGTAITTANTESQLQSKTWAELGRWHTLMINSHWFERSTMALKPAQWLADIIDRDLKVSAQYYYASAQTWSEEKADAFAGAHNPLGMLVIFDEASGIPKNIWDVADGFFTDIALHRYFFCFSNPRRNTGEFYECFHKNRDDWYRRNLDSRDVEGSDIEYLNKIVLKHGDDSDEARMEVKGQFPSQGDKQFISREAVEGAMERDTEADHHAGLIMGIDIARFGDDSTVFCFRRGRDARSIKMIKLKGRDNMEVANEAAFWIGEYNPDAVCIDAGNGTGVIDRLREMGYKVNEVWFGSKADSEEWADMRTEMWARMREWLPGGCIPNDKDLKDDLVGPEYGFNKSDKMKLESKEMMKKRGIASPDAGDALALTFAVRVARSDLKAMRHSKKGARSAVKGTDYNIFD